MITPPPPTAPLLRLNAGTPELLALGSLQAGTARYEAGPAAEAAYQAAVLRGWSNAEMPQASATQRRIFEEAA